MVAGGDEGVLVGHGSSGGGGDKKHACTITHTLTRSLHSSITHSLTHTVSLQV